MKTEKGKNEPTTEQEIAAQATENMNAADTSVVEATAATPATKKTKAEIEADAKKKFREQLKALKVARDAELEEAKKMTNRGQRGDKNNSSYAIRHTFFTDMTKTPKEVFELVKVKFPDVKQAFVSTLMSDARAVYSVLEDLRKEKEEGNTEGQAKQNEQAA